MNLISTCTICDSILRVLQQWLTTIARACVFHLSLRFTVLICSTSSVSHCWPWCQKSLKLWMESSLLCRTTSAWGLTDLFCVWVVIYYGLLCRTQFYDVVFFSPPCAALRLVAALLFRSAWFRSLCSSSSMRFMWVYFQFQHICLNNSWLKMFSPFFQDVGFVLVFSDIHLWASIFSVILVNYIFMDGKCDYFQGKSYWSNSPATIDCGREIPYGLCFHRHCSCGGLLHPVGTLLLCSSSTHLLTCFQKYIYKIP